MIVHFLQNPIIFYLHLQISDYFYRLSNCDELNEEFAKNLLIENNNNDIMQVPVTEPPKSTDNTNSTPNKVFKHIKIFEDYGSPESNKPSPAVCRKPHVPKNNKNLVKDYSAADKNRLVTPTSDLTTVARKTKYNVPVQNNIRNFNEKPDDKVEAPKQVTKRKSDESAKINNMDLVNDNQGTDSISKVSSLSLNDVEKSADSRSSFVNDYNVDYNKPPTTINNMKPTVSETVKYRAPKPPTSTVTASPIKLDDQAVRRIIMGEESPMPSPEKPKLRPKPSGDKDSWLLQQKEKVKVSIFLV